MLLAVKAEQITVIAICIAALIFILFDIYLVISLHRHNKILVRKRRSAEKAAERAPLPENNAPIKEQENMDNNV